MFKKFSFVKGKSIFECVVGKSREKLIGSSIYNCLPKEETEKLIAEIFDKEKDRYIELTADIPGK